MIQQLKIYWHYKRITVVPDSFHKILTEYNDYYVNLNDALKLEFLKRVYVCNKFLIFKPVKLSHVSEEMRVVIISALVQITFGLDRFVLQRFKTFLVVPNIYNYGPYPALHGHVDHDKKLIVMAWPSVQHGFIVPEDAHNVALHELAHALQAENHSNLFFADFFDAVHVSDWEKVGLIELWKIRRNQSEYLSDYAGQNMLELFAVSMECFFEQPLQFQKKVPELYLIMTKLLKQNPANATYPLLKR